VLTPSGRWLNYQNPRIDANGSITFKGVHQNSKKWVDINTYSGKLVENLTQSVSRCLLASSFQPIEDAGYEIVLTVHDEIICETPDSPEFNAEHLAKLMSAGTGWSEGLPLAAAGFECYRYRKG
jgi:DNA polymerase